MKTSNLFDSYPVLERFTKFRESEMDNNLQLKLFLRKPLTRILVLGSPLSTKLILCDSYQSNLALKFSPYIRSTNPKIHYTWSWSSVLVGLWETDDTRVLKGYRIKL